MEAEVGGGRLDPHVDVRRAGDRYRTRTAWLDSRHSFSTGPHYDPANTSFGLLLLHDEHLLAPGSGFDPHPHRDLEILTWVVQGSLVHEDSSGQRAVLRPGVVQLMSAGSGVVHSERNDAVRPGGDLPSEPVRFVQAWVAPDRPGGAPRLAQDDVDALLAGGALVPVVSGRDAHDSAVRIGNRDAALHAARLRAGSNVLLPEAPYVHVFVTAGGVALEGAGELGAGDAARCTAAAGMRLTASEHAEVLVWEMHARR